MDGPPRGVRVVFRDYSPTRKRAPRRDPWGRDGGGHAEAWCECRSYRNANRLRCVESIGPRKKMGLLPIEWVNWQKARLKPRLSRDDSKPLFGAGLNECATPVRRGSACPAPRAALTSNTLRNGNETGQAQRDVNGNPRPRVERDKRRSTAVWCSVQGPFFLNSSFPFPKKLLLDSAIRSASAGGASRVAWCVRELRRRLPSGRP